MSDLIEIDGSIEEGGGQILRISLALSAILKKSFRLTNIRKNRSKPGLQPQHLTGVKAAARMTNSKAIGAELGSVELEFSPERIIGGRYDIDIGTAGSSTLLLQSVLPILLYADRQSHIIVTGGTHASHSPTIEYFEHAFLPVVRRFGVSADISIDSFGWFPKGGGRTNLFVKPSKISSVNMTDKGNLVSIQGVCSLSSLPNDILVREEEGVRYVFPGAGIQHSVKQSLSPGTALTLWAEFENSILGVSEIGKKGVRAEELGKRTAESLQSIMKSNGAVDEWMSDQLLVFMALAKGKSQLKVPKITSHVKTCLKIIPMFTNISFEVNKDIISVEGIEH